MERDYRPPAEPPPERDTIGRILSLRRSGGVGNDGNGGVSRRSGHRTQMPQWRRFQSFPETAMYSAGSP